jgi:CHAD domain-containing protein
MAFQLKAGESLPRGMRRIARRQMDKALEQFSGAAGGSRDKAVHEVRKCFKRIRAVLRLVRPEIGEAAYRRENYCLRDAGRPLIEVRDAKVLIAALDNLTKHFAGHVAGRSFADVRKELQASQRAVRKRVLDEQDAFAAVAAAVRQVRERVRDWAGVRDRWPSVGDGLRQVYQQASRAFAAAAADPTVEKLHEWRKQTKYLRYQLEILEPVWPAIMEELADQADRLGTLLGDDHDLAVLRQTLAANPEPFGDRDTLEVLLALIDRRRLELQHEAGLLGQRFFQDRPRNLVRRLRGYWKTWRAENEEAKAEESQPAGT